MVQKLVVGLTGGFGTGKTSVAQFFRKLGAEVLDADEIAHRALKKGSPVFDQVVELFSGPHERNVKKLDRAKIADEVFTDAKKRERLEALIHPYVYGKIKDKIEASSRDVIVIEVPLLFEAGFETLCDKVVVVKCDYAAKQKRLMRKRYTVQEIRARERAQMAESLKIKKADFVLDNSRSIYETRRETERLWTKLNKATA